MSRNLFDAPLAHTQIPPVAMPESYRAILTIESAVAHGDAGANAVGPNNTTLFCRELIGIEKTQAALDGVEAQATLTRLCNAVPVGSDVIPFLESLTGAQLVASLFTAQIPVMYSGEGAGLFSGLTRYDYLATRLGNGAATNSTLATLFNYLALKLQLPMYPEKHYPAMTAFFTLPVSVQAGAIRAMSSAIQLVIMAAREVAESQKLTIEEYARKAKKPMQTQAFYQPNESQISDFTAENSDNVFVPVPSVSGNALRHCLFRAPAATRLLHELGLDPATKRITKGVELFLYGGGNTASGAKTPENADVLEMTARALYPSIDALGGATDRFVFNGEGKLKPACWIVCKENNRTTSQLFGVTSQTSIFDMIEDTTRTRSGVGSSLKESGQMIFSYETLCKGAQLVLEIGFAPWTSKLAIGSMLQAFADWSESGIFAGRSGAGHGRLSMEYLDDRDAGELSDEYLDYLRTEKDRLAVGLLDKTFCTGVELCQMI